jgi:hypothetical protein
VSVFFLKSRIPLSPDRKKSILNNQALHKTSVAITEYTTIIKYSCRARILNLLTEIKMSIFDKKAFGQPDKLQEKLTM